MQYSISKELRDSLTIEMEHYLECRLGDSCNRCKKLINDMCALKVKF